MTACFFAGFPDAGACDGPLIRAHLLPQQVIKRDVRTRVRANALANGSPLLEARRIADRWARRACDDPRCWVPCCGGLSGLAGHHEAVDSRKLRLTRDQLPAGLEEFAAEHGPVWWLERSYPLVNERSSDAG